MESRTQGIRDAIAQVEKTNQYNLEIMLVYRLSLLRFKAAHISSIDFL